MKRPQRILHYGYDVDQLTLLDYEQGPDPYDDAGPAHAWEGIRFVDNYYGTGEGIGLGGNSLTGAWNLYLPSVGHTSFQIGIPTAYRRSTAITPAMCSESIKAYGQIQRGHASLSRRRPTW